MKLKMPMKSVVLSKNEFKDVPTKWTPPEGLFSKSASAIAKAVIEHHTDLKSALASISFYLNRGGSNISAEEQGKLNKVKGLLKKHYK